jgi:hypothetical protein
MSVWILDFDIHLTFGLWHLKLMPVLRFKSSARPLSVNSILEPVIKQHRFF